MNLDERIANFKQMADADPQNELGHFSLGKAYLDAGRHEEACACFERVIELKDDFSKAYELLGQARRALGRQAEAIAILRRGCEVAAARGDELTLEIMRGSLRELGEEPPDVQVAVESERPPDSVMCCRCGRAGRRLTEKPLQNELGEQIVEHVCQNCWQGWLVMGTKVINELRLDFAAPGAAEMYDTHLREFLQLPS